MNKHRKDDAKPWDVLSAGTGIPMLHTQPNMLHVQTKLENNINFKKFLIRTNISRLIWLCFFARLVIKFNDIITTIIHALIPFPLS